MSACAKKDVRERGDVGRGEERCWGRGKMFEGEKKDVREKMEDVRGRKKCRGGDGRGNAPGSPNWEKNRRGDERFGASPRRYMFLDVYAET
jgi:hypothetical protein